MTKTTDTLVIAINHAGAAPEWLHVLPAGEFKGKDGRGPYAAPDMDALISLFGAEGTKLVVDENHSTDLAAKRGESAPARGWIVELQKRDDGLYGRVEWTPEGERMMDAKEYGFLSPTFMHTAARPFKVAKLLRVALTNDPNLTNLKSLHSSEENAMLEQLRKALGLPETADEAAVLAAVTASHTAQATHTALIGRIAEAAGVAKETAPDALVIAIQSRDSSSAVEQENADLKQTVLSLQSKFTTLANDTAKDKATAFVTTAVEAGKVIPALKDHYIARHMKNPAEVEHELSLMPALNAGGLNRDPGEHKDTPAITDDDKKVMAMMGVDPEAYAKTHATLFAKAQ
jgi:phage I-like protein